MTGVQTCALPILPDPYYGDDQDFEHMLDLIEVACDGLVAQLNALR